MERIAYQRLVQWKQQKERMPLILRGARQVGKSFLLKQFGQKEFKKFHLFDFEKSTKELLPIFNSDLSANKLINELSLYVGQQIDEKQDLLIFDEIQNCPRALTSLKYFCEEKPNLAICAAGSLLGISLSDSSFPVGKVEYLDLYPLNFEEFLMSLNNSLLLKSFHEGCQTGLLPHIAHTKLWDTLKYYYVVGGMPKAVSLYLENQALPLEALTKVREMQKAILSAYYSDFSKHAGKVNAMHISRVFENIPEQLSQNIDNSVQKFRFKDVIPNKRTYADLDGPIDWLVKAGLVYKVKICNHAEVPLKAFCKQNLFKLFFFDIGLLGAMLDLSPQSLILQDYGITKGFFAENFVAQELTFSGEQTLYSWTERNSEIEFILDINGVIIPVEVKSGIRTKAQSLKQYFFKYNPQQAIQISAKPLNLKGKIKNYPLYLAPLCRYLKSS